MAFRLPPLDRIATYVIPTLAVATAAVVLLGPGTRRPALGARVRGVPVDGAATLALRVETVRRLFGVDDAAPSQALTVTVQSASSAGPLVWEGTSAADGIAEAIVRVDGNAPASFSGRLDVRITQGARVLADGAFATRPARGPTFQLATVVGASRGDLRVEVELPRGTLAAPFEDEVRIRVATADGAPAAAGTHVTLAADGADVAPTELSTDRSGVASPRVRPTLHEVELRVDARDAEGRTGHWEGHLPIRPGALWLAPVASTSPVAGRDAALPSLRIVSPVQRARAYVSVVGERGRLFGASVTLSPDGAGFHAGQLDLGAQAPWLARERLLFAVLAGDPFEQGAGTTTWPLRPSEGSVAAPALELLLDGVPAAERVETARAGSARYLAIVVVLLAAVVEVTLVLLRARASQRALEEHMRRALAADGGAPTDEERAALLESVRDDPRLRAVGFAAMVGMAFAVLAAFLALR